MRIKKSSSTTRTTGRITPALFIRTALIQGWTNDPRRYRSGYWKIFIRDRTFRLAQGQELIYAGKVNHGFDSASAKSLQFARPMVRRCARLNADQTRRQLLEERQDSAALQLAADNHRTSGINSVNLDHRLGSLL
jgi:hypothetical protein